MNHCNSMLQSVGGPRKEKGTEPTTNTPEMSCHRDTQPCPLNHGVSPPTLLNLLKQRVCWPCRDVDLFFTGGVSTATPSGTTRAGSTLELPSRPVGNCWQYSFDCLRCLQPKPTLTKSKGSPFQLVSQSKQPCPTSRTRIQTKERAQSAKSPLENTFARREAWKMTDKTPQTKAFKPGGAGAQ